MELIIKKMQKLITLLNQYNYAYYVDSTSLVTDETYDALLMELRALEDRYPDLIQANSPSLRVGSVVVDKFEKIPHSRRMLSINNLFNQAEVCKFDADLRKLIDNFSYVIEPKIDGVSIALVYRDNHLVYALTRGDGGVGENVVHNVKKIKSIPLFVTQGLGNFEVRGEIFFTKANFAKLNAGSAKQFANVRNAASGSIRLQNNEVLDHRHLSFLAYELLTDSCEITTQYTALMALKKMQFPIVDYLFLVDDVATLLHKINEYASLRKTFNYETDGLVIKLNEFNLRAQVGYTAKFPKWAIAFKFPANIATTKIIDIQATVGRTGKITYLACFEPVKLDGSLIKHATLHNYDYIKDKQIGINDYVDIYKAGEIIPKVIGKNLALSPVKNPVYTKLFYCPACHDPLHQNAGEVDQYCVNVSCPEKKIQQLVHWCSKEAMNCQFLSKAIIVKLFQKGFIQTVKDLYLLKEKRKAIVNSDLKIRAKLFKKLVAHIELTKQNSLERIIFGLGIKNIGQQASLILAQQVQDLNRFLSFNFDDLSVFEIGSVSLKSIKEWLSQPQNRELISFLLAQQFNPLFLQNYPVQTDHLFFQKRVVITGKLFLPRRDLTQLLSSRFLAIMQTRVTQQTDFLILGEKPSSKYQKALELNIRIITQTELGTILDS